MNPPVGARIKALLVQPDRPLSNLRLVMLANGGTALASAIVACLAFSWPLAWVAAVAPLLFLSLGACLLFKYSFWVPAGLVALVHGAAGALLLAYLAARVQPMLRWPGGAVGFVIPFLAIFRMYGQVAKGARQTDRALPSK